MGKSSPEKARTMAWLYVNGPEHLQGDWNRCAEAAGYSRPPRDTNTSVNNFIKQFSQDSAELQSLLGGVESSDWEELAERARPVLAKIAAGTVFATTQQMAALREIVNRGEGKVGKRAQDVAEVGVVVLPMLGNGIEASFCPRCVAQLQQEGVDAARSMDS